MFKLLYIKLNTFDRETHWATSYYELSTSETPRSLKGVLRATKSLKTACKFYICQFSRILDMLYIKIDPNDMETHLNISCHES